jgi:hypothetical protein
MRPCIQYCKNKQTKKFKHSLGYIARPCEGKKRREGRKERKSVKLVWGM